MTGGGRAPRCWQSPAGGGVPAIMLGSVIVRRATARDASAARSVYLDAWRAGYRSLLAEDELEVQARRRASYDWLGAIAHADRTVAVAEDDRHDL